MIELDRKNCPMRADNGNCLPVGGFCTAVNDIFCEIAQRAYDKGFLQCHELLKEKQPKLLTLSETINAKYPMDVFCEIKGEERIFAVTAPVPAQWIGKPDIRYWTARPTEEQRKAEPWKDGEQE